MHHQIFQVNLSTKKFVFIIKIGNNNYKKKNIFVAENMSDSRDQLSDKDCIHSLSDRATSESNY